MWVEIGTKGHVVPEPQNMTLFGVRVFADVVKATISRLITGVLVRERRFETQKRVRELREVRMDSPSELQKEPTLPTP